MGKGEKIERKKKENKKEKKAKGVSGNQGVKKQLKYRNGAGIQKPE